MNSRLDEQLTAAVGLLPFGIRHPRVFAESGHLLDYQAPERAGVLPLPVRTYGWVAVRAWKWQAATVNGAKLPGAVAWLDAARHPMRRDGAVLWALLLLPWVVTLVLVRRHHHLDVAAETIFAVSLGLPTLWVAWAAYRGPRRSGTR